MTPAELRAICDSLNPGGQTRLAELLGWDASTIRRKLSGATKISRADQLAILKAVEMAEVE
jgi:DNA-binding transcriptional regulator YdaS (Cro superfamily)